MARFGRSALYVLTSVLGASCSLQAGLNGDSHANTGGDASASDAANRINDAGLADPDGSIALPDSSPEPPDPSLLAFFEFENAPSGGVVTSSTGAFSGNCSNCPTTAAGVNGNGYIFDGVDDLFRITQNDALNTAQGTISVWLNWVNKDAVAVARPYGVGGDNSWIIGAWKDAKLMMQAPGYYSDAGLNSFPYGVWLHVAATWTASNSKVYLNGQLLLSAGTSQAFDTNDIYVGADLNAPGLQFFFQGTMDELRIYNRALSAEEIAAQFASAKP